jgi:tetratricopeptide (TPR) repeat protein
MLEIRKAQELDLVEVLEDLPKYDIKKGEVGVVVEAFDNPDEAYDLEFVDQSGQSRFAYSVKPNQIRSVEETAKEAFERGLVFIEEGKPFEAEREFQRAIDLRPAYIVDLHNLICRTFENTIEWEKLIVALRLVSRLNPDYEVEGYNISFFVRNNLAMAYQNYAIQKANEKDLQTALVYFGFAMGVASRSETISLIRKNLSIAYTSLGIQATQSRDYITSLECMRRACEIDSNDMTRHNLGLAYAQAAKHFLDQYDYEKAASVFEHAIDIGLVFAELLNDYGMALAISGHQDDAILALQRAMKLTPDNETIQHNLRLVESGAIAGFNTEEIKAEFYPTPPMQQQEHFISV